MFFFGQINIITEGDRRKAHVDNEHKWLTRFNQTNIRCPSEGSYEFKITYVEITTQSVNRCSSCAFDFSFFQFFTFLFSLQSSSYANYKVIDGGIGQKFIEVNVETEFIDCISYDGYVYGGSSAALPSLGLLAAIIALTFFLPK